MTKYPHYNHIQIHGFSELHPPLSTLPLSTLPRLQKREAWIHKTYKEEFKFMPEQFSKAICFVYLQAERL